MKTFAEIYATRFNPLLPRARNISSKDKVLDLHLIMSNELVCELAINKIDIGQPLTPTNPSDVEMLRESFYRSKQHTPVLLRLHADDRLTLLDGWGRIAALLLNGESVVLARILRNISDQDARLHQLISNQRKVLPALDRAIQDFEFLEMTREKVSQVAAPLPGGAQPADKCHAKAAKEMGVTKARIARAEQIACILPPVQARIRELGLQHKQSALLAIAKAGDTSDLQFAKAEELSALREKPRGVKSNSKAAQINKTCSGAPISNEDLTIDLSDVPDLLDRRVPSFENVKDQWEKLKRLVERLDPETRERFNEECFRSGL